MLIELLRTLLLAIAHTHWWLHVALPQLHNWGLTATCHLRADRIHPPALVCPVREIPGMAHPMTAAVGR